MDIIVLVKSKQGTEVEYELSINQERYEKDIEKLLEDEYSLPSGSARSILFQHDLYDHFERAYRTELKEILIDRYKDLAQEQYDQEQDEIEHPYSSRGLNSRNFH